MTSANPTLLIGLGAFGRRVTRLVALPGSAEHDAAQGLSALQVIDADEMLDRGSPGRAGESASASADRAAGAAAAEGAGDGTAEIIAGLTTRARDVCRRLLALGHFVDTTAPTDARGPRLDVFVIGDLGDERVTGCVPGLVESLAHELRAAFRPILGAGEGALAVCPMLVAPRSADAGRLGACIRSLAGLARHPEPTRRPQARIYLIEDQSGKYILPIDELERSFAAFLSLILKSRLRDDRGVRDLVEPGTSDRVGPFATFACATLEIDTNALERLCAYKLARELLGEFDVGVLTLSEIAGEAHPLVPDRTSVESALWKEGTQGTLEEYLEPPRIHVPEIAWTDSPEDIMEHKLGPMWQLETERTLERFQSEVERFKMDRLAKQIEANGTELAIKVEAEIMSKVRAHALASPRGPERALEFARYAMERAHSLRDEIQRDMEAPNLRPFPASPLASGMEAIRLAAHAWPRQRPPRMRLIGGLAALVSAFMVAALVHMAIRTAGASLPWWVSAALGTAMAISSVSYSLWRHRKRHHNWLCQARSDLDAALERHIRREIVDYFRRRLEYTRALWTYRIYRSIADRLAGVVVQLEAARAAVDEAARRLEAGEHELSQTRKSSGLSGILYRSVLDTDTVHAFYRHARPADLGAVAARFHAEATGQAVHASDRPGEAAPAPPDVFEAPYADPERALAFALREFAHVRTLSPYEEADSPLYQAVAGSVKRYLEQLALKLSPPLEVIAVNAPDAPAPRSVLIAPPEARPLIERTLAAENLDRGWDIRSVSGDGRRIHLLLERGELPLDAVALASVPGALPARQPAGGRVP